MTSFYKINDETDTARPVLYFDIHLDIDGKDRLRRKH
jgi:hypothetical protein